MSEKGITLVETILTLVILFIIVGTIIPLTYQMHSTLHNKKLELHASETALQAARNILTRGRTTGVNKIDNVTYQWEYVGNEICIEYNNLHGVQKKCINQFGERK